MQEKSQRKLGSFSIHIFHLIIIEYYINNHRGHLRQAISQLFEGVAYIL